MANRLAAESSPYLLQHKDNPVDWYPWGEEALDKSRREDKPIFLSVGYAACHWCHVMEHESFEDPETAAMMNEHFVNIKVDREERPDIDNIYMKSVVAITGQGGWPMSVFLTPDGRPFFGGTYFPPVRRYNMPSFKEVLLSLVKAWDENREQLETNGDQLHEHLKKEFSPQLESEGLSKSVLNQASMTLAQHYDWDQGGWGRAPKFPQPMAIAYLLQRSTQRDKLALDMAQHALEAMAKGGMYDVVGGGFCRYSVDDFWLVPHFEKMLYDNAQLAQVYLHTHLITGDHHYRRVCEETLDFVLREMTDPAGGFYSSLDADSEGEEGIFYTWLPEELEAIFSENDMDFLRAAYPISQEGNFEGRIILQRQMTDEALGAKFDLEPSHVQAHLEELHAVLLEERSARVRPATDDKVLTAWNGMMLAAFSEAARYLGRRDYLEAAQKNAVFIQENLFREGRLHRSWRRGITRHNGYLEDHGALILGLLALYQADPDPRWFQLASEITEEMIDNFHDPAGGFYDTRSDHEALLVRPKDLQDNATPSGNALAAHALLLMAAYTGDGIYRDLAEVSLSGIQKIAGQYPTAFSRWLQALDFALGPVQEIAILGNSEEAETASLRTQINSRFRPYTILAASDFPPPPGHPPLLTDRPLVDGRPTAYVCEKFVCQAPVNSADALRQQLLDS